ncbi:hypothetical protein ACTJJ0_25055 [Chitinophaga sp. 22321]|uniref:Uncharacterized protein n=1 Tax=Chitinophaga hostae TaxID=2831022 RepID=A0ABS5J0Z3_9BACT|nr:hypothetical protein [Chitinophaga hostae]MBS0028731.1 hypothetical protein [Chitinophaga hostae]
MSKFLRDVLLFTGIPLFILLLICLGGDEGILGAMILALVLVGAYFILGLILVIAGQSHTGKVMLLSSGIILLIGLSTCGIIASGLNFH